MMFFKRIKWFIQRGRRGFSDKDLWSIHDYLAEIIPPMIREYSKKVHGCPSELYNVSRKNDECRAWHVILEEIAQGFESAKFLNSAGYSKMVKTEDGKHYKMETDQEALDNAAKKVEKGLALFAKYFLSLWD